MGAVCHTSGELLDMEYEAARLITQIEEGRTTKRDVLAEMVEVERQVRRPPMAKCCLNLHLNAPTVAGFGQLQGCV